MALSIYVGTYRKYNSGSIAGKWLDVTDYACKQDFLEACEELHKDESDPEFMFQDHEGIPKAFISESTVSDKIWSELVDLDDDDREMYELYLDNIDCDADFETARESFQGRFDNESDWAAQYIEDCYDTKAMGNLANYIDYEAFARDCRLGGDIDVIQHEGYSYIFNSH